MDNININQSVAILCDGNNIERSIHELSKSKNTMINFDELIPKLLNGRGLNRFYYFLLKFMIFLNTRCSMGFSIKRPFS